MILQSAPRKLTLAHVLLPYCQEYVSFVEIFIYFSISWKEGYKWKRKLLLDRSLPPSHLPLESCPLTIATFTLWICQVVGHLLFTVWRNGPVIYLFLFEPFSTTAPGRRHGSGGGFDSPMVPRSDEHVTHHVCSVPRQSVAALCRVRHPHPSLRWVSERFSSHVHGAKW